MHGSEALPTNIYIAVVRFNFPGLKTLGNGQRSYQQKFTADGWKEGVKVTYLPMSAITLLLRFAYSRVKIDHNIYLHI